MNRRSLLAALAVPCLMASGCVSDERYRELLIQNESLQRTNEGLVSENDSVRRTNEDLRLLQQRAEAEATRERERQMATQVAFERLSDKIRGMASMPGVSVDPSGVIRLEGEVFFETGKAELRKKAEETLKKLAEGLQGEASKGRFIRIQGHTDDQPVVVNKDTYPSNWHLSGARALNVLLFLETSGVPSGSLSFCGYGEYRPREANARGRKGNKVNRRVEIAILE